MKCFVLLAIAVGTLAACDNETQTQSGEPAVRGLKTILIKETAQTTVRRYPSVIQPASISTLSFEVPGRLKELSLDVGQRVKAGDILAEIDTRSLDLQVETAEASLGEMRSLAKNALEDAERKQLLFEKKVITKAAADQSRTEAEASASRVVQAQRSLDTAREDLKKATLYAPFDGIINSVEAESFSNVATGASIATIYTTDTFETSFSVSFDVVNKLTVGKKAKVRLADNPNINLVGHVSELGARADTVSSFPVVVKLDQTDPSIKAGMAVEISMEFTVPLGEGFSLPLSVLPLDGQLDANEDANEPGKTQVFIFDPASSTVSRRDVLVAGVRENTIIIVDGLELGERVASAGVSFLREGQKVKLLSEQK